MSKKRRLSTLTIVPSARRLVGSLRDLGYDFVHAVADLVDNSVAADASEVRIDLHFEGPGSWLRIADDGCGMAASQLNEAMRFGSERLYAHDDPGKFGLGLKTASLSQCRRVWVASRRRGARTGVGVRCLDLDHVEAANRWEILLVEPRDADPEVLNALRRGASTVVLWRALDRMMHYKLPAGGRARGGLDALAAQLREHLGMVFHRFVAGDVRGRRKLRMTVNSERVVPWDPFATSEVATEALPGAELDVSVGGFVGVVRFRPYVLPHERSFSTPDAFRTLAGPAKWNAQQGFYIYRANRMIQSGGWCRMRTPDEHAKLARGAIDFFPDLDPAFEVNVAKFRVNLPSELRDRLTPHVESWVRRAVARYRQAETNDSAVALPARSQRQGAQSTFLVQARAALESAARMVDQVGALRRILRTLAVINPEIALALGCTPPLGAGQHNSTVGSRNGSRREVAMAGVPNAK